MYKVFTILGIITSGLILTLFLFFLRDTSKIVEEKKRIPIDVILKNKLSAPMLSSFPAHNTNNFRGCLTCHGISISADNQRIRNKEAFKKETPLIPHEYIQNLNCLSCHQHESPN